MADKRCERCQETWPIDHEFYRAKNAPWCLACEKEAKYKKGLKRVRSAEYKAKQVIANRLKRQKARTEEK